MAPSVCYRLPMDKCPACDAKLAVQHTYKHTKVYGFGNPRTVTVQSMRCSFRSCRATYGPNWVWQKGKKGRKLNVISADILKPTKRFPKSRPLFVTQHFGFEVDFLQYHLQMMFRGSSSWSAVTYAVSQTWDIGGNPRHWRVNFSKAFMYYAMLKEWSPLNLHGSIVIDDVDTVALNKYKAFVHDQVFPEQADPGESTDSVYSRRNG